MKPKHVKHCLLGAIAGDIVGSIYEFAPLCVPDDEFPLFGEDSRYTDDTVLTLAVSQGIMQGFGNPGKTREAIIEALQRYAHVYWQAGYGQQFFQWVLKKQRTPYNSYGNGSAMRVSAVAWAYDTLEDVERYATISAEVTHNHPEGIKGACATAAAIFLARTNAGKETIRAYLAERYGYNLSRTLDEIRQNYCFAESCQESVPEAIISFLESESFEDTLRKAVSLHGDSDTQAAIAGSIAEAFYDGVPDDIAVKAISLLDDGLRGMLGEWQKWLTNRHRPSCSAAGSE